MESRLAATAFECRRNGKEVAFVVFSLPEKRVVDDEQSVGEFSAKAVDKLDFFEHTVERLAVGVEVEAPRCGVDVRLPVVDEEVYAA